MFVFSCTKERKEEVPFSYFSMAIGYGGLMHECFPKHSRMGTARMKEEKETGEEGKKRGVSLEGSKASTNKKFRRPITTKSKHNINKHNMVLFYKKYKKYNEFQFTKNKMDLNNRKMTNHPPSPVQVSSKYLYKYTPKT